MSTRKIAVGAILAMVLCAAAAGEDPRLRVAFNIAPQAIGPALTDLGQQAGLQVLVRGEDVRGLQPLAKPVTGELTVRAALNEVLADTGLTYKFLNDRTVRVAREKAPQANVADKNPEYFNISTLSPVKIRLAEGESSSSNTGDSTNNEDPANKNAPQQPQEIVVKGNPFRLQKEQGYKAANSITATGIGTAIKDVPIAINVMTSDFLRDRKSQFLQDILAEVPGVNPGGPTEWSGWITVRGFLTGMQVDGFNLPLFIVTGGQSFGIDRVEVLKGPASIFNGIVTPGGTVNAIYKRPSFTQENYVDVMYGSYDHMSGEFYSSGPLIKDKLAYLVNGYRKTSEGWQDYSFANEKNYMVGLTYTPTEWLNLSLNYRDIHAISDPRLPNGVGYNQGFLDAAARGEIPEGTFAPAWVLANKAPNEPTTNVWLMPWGDTHASGGPQASLDQRLMMFNPEVVVNVNEHITIRDTYMKYKGEFFRRMAAIFGNVDPVFYGPGSYVFLQTLIGESETNKLEALLKFNTGPVSHKVLFGWEHREDQTWGGAATTPIPLPWNPLVNGPVMIDHLLNARWPNGEHYRISRPGPYNLNVKAYYAVEQATALEERLHVLLGYRWTEQDTNSFINPRHVVVSKATPQVGVLFRPFKTGFLKDTGFFVNWAKTFEPSGAVDAFGTIIPPSSGTGKEVGFKTDWLDGRVSSTVSIFRDEKSDVAQVDWTRMAVTGLSPLYNLGGVIRTEGAELDLMWTPNNQLQVRAGYAYMPTAEPIAFPSDPYNVGVRAGSTPEHSGNITAKYYFAGPLNGLYVGGSALASGRYRAHALVDWTMALWAPGFVQYDAFAGYDTQLFGQKANFSLNIRNVSDRRGYYNGFGTPNDPIRGYISARVFF